MLPSRFFPGVEPKGSVKGTSRFYPDEGEGDDDLIGQYVVVGLGQVVGGQSAATSPGAIQDLVEASVPGNPDLRCVAWSPELGIFVACENNFNHVYASPTGEEWVQVADLPGVGGVTSVAWSPELGLFAAITLGGGGIYVSPDGINWAESLTPASNRFGGYRIMWAPNLERFVALITDTGDGAGNAADLFLSSDDGVTWDVATFPYVANFTVDLHNYSGLTWSPQLGKIVAVAASGHTKQSTDGINWVDGGFINNPNPGVKPNWALAAWSPKHDRLVAIRNYPHPLNYAEAFYSDDGGATWQDGVLLIPGNHLFDILWADDRQEFVAVGREEGFDATSQHLVSSLDGINWTGHQSGDYYFGVARAENLNLDIIIPPPPNALAAQWQGDHFALTWQPNRSDTYNVKRSNTPGGPYTTIATGLVDPEYDDGDVVYGQTRYYVVTGENDAGESDPSNEASASPPPAAPTNLVVTAGSQNNLLNWNAAAGAATYKVKRANVAGGPYATIASGVAATTYQDTGLTAGQTYYYVVCGTNASGDGPNSNEDDGTPTAPQTLLVAVAPFGGTPNEVMTSPDATTWTLRTAAVEHGWRGVARSPSLALFAAVADQGNGSGGSLQRVMTSPDGINWTARSVSSTLAGASWRRVTWSPALGLFVAIARTSSNSTKVMTSPDGINWTGRTSPAGFWTDIVWSPELSLFVVIADSASNFVMTSPDGINWTARTAPSIGWTSVTWSPTVGLFVAVSGSSPYVMTSPDGINWTTRSPAANLFWNSVTWSPTVGLFVAVASNGVGNRVMTSPDGINWTSRSSASDSGWNIVVWNPALALFIALAGPNVMTSPDGINWTAGNAVGSGWQALAFS